MSKLTVHLKAHTVVCVREILTPVMSHTVELLSVS